MTDATFGVLDSVADTAADRTVPAPSAIADRVEAAGATAVVTSDDDLAEEAFTAIVAPGDRAVAALAARAPSTPILPVEAGRGLRSVAAASIEEAIAGVLEGVYSPQERRLLSVDVDGKPTGRAAFDVMLVTRDPAKISEYAVRSGDDLVDQFRADGIVVATPAGSGGYAAAAGGPTLAPGTGAAVVPVAPFTTDRDHWVLDPDAGVTLTVERDEGAVELLVDDESHGVVAPRTPISLRADRTLPVLVGPQSRPRWP